mmetsp:Transcript_60086/g.82304  ORF Transcript_60086/g.82304 Transcript_60086/m.82304 type:complete len:348 (-) Transcript_60086:483-1526(-)
MFSCFTKKKPAAGGPVLDKAAPGLFDVLCLQDATTSATVISVLKSDPTFTVLSKCEAEAIIARDQEDDQKLEAGIQISIASGSLAVQDEPPKYKCIDVLGKTPDDVCDIILADVGDAAQEGCVIVLCGLSGTGKGTTVEKLKSKLPNATPWSNGNVFRSLTLLAVTWCEQQGMEAFNAEAALTRENIEQFMSMLSFGKFVDDMWDIRINGLGLDLLVSQVKNTDLKDPKVGKNIPTVAEVTQGDVVKFAAGATSQMGADGINVLLEGRQATVNYVPTPFRYTLVMSNPVTIGERRAAQRIAASALAALESGEGALDDQATESGLREALASIFAEIPQLTLINLAAKS